MVHTAMTKNILQISKSKFGVISRYCSVQNIRKKNPYSHKMPNSASYVTGCSGHL